MQHPPFGVYVHFPYCLAKCPYCDFVSYAKAPEQIQHRRYADAVIRELEARAPAFAGHRLDTIFFGGGTPSLWEPAELGRVVAAVARAFPTKEAVEVTVECNPSSLTPDRVQGLLEGGATRLSVGVQSLDRARLDFLGRLHDPDGGLRAVEAALAGGVPRVSADLIFGVQGGRPEAAADAAAEARRVAATGVTHVSAYGLTIEPGTRFGELARKGSLPIATDDTIADSFFAVEDALEGLGFGHYETSNYARPGDESRHNLGYWRGRPYLGLGVAAVGCEPPRAPGTATRYKNKIQPEPYMATVERGEVPTHETEALDGEARLRERIMLGLRLREGLDLDAAAREVGVDPEARRGVVERLLLQGRLETVGDAGARVRVPKRLGAVLDGIVVALF
jgi:putative oxygen-independent coproporphyrinogen III oxidase